MKKVALALILLLVAFRSAAQNSPADTQTIQMLKEFYTIYHITFYSATKANWKFFPGKLHELQKRYCTRKLYNNLKNDNLDHDFLISDLYTDSLHLNTLTVVKNPTQVKHYIVSYIAPVSAGQIKELKAVFNVGVEKEDGDFKISTLINETKYPW
jgi:hypothetical protein